MLDVPILHHPFNGLCRLVEQGFTLVDLGAHVRGNLFGDMVIRFKSDKQHGLGNHRFGVGDAVKISVLRDGTGRASKGTVGGVVLDRRASNIDICIKPSDMHMFSRARTYRLDCFVNELAYDRMRAGLTAFTSTGKKRSETDQERTISRTIRDLIIYSYPNAMLRLAQSPGGLRVALPYIPPSADDGDEVKIIKEKQPKKANAPEPIQPIFATHEKLRHLAAIADDDDDSDIEIEASRHCHTKAELDRALLDLTKIQKKYGQAALNDSQVASIRHALQLHPISLIQGPPGTGKVGGPSLDKLLSSLFTDTTFLLNRRRRPATCSPRSSC